MNAFLVSVPGTNESFYNFEFLLDDDFLGSSSNEIWTKWTKFEKETEEEKNK